MCGLSGYSGKQGYNLDKLKLIMLWNSIERGKDATGIFTPNSGIIKDNDSAGIFFYGKKIEELKEDNELIAHVRAKTIGANSVANAHPFKFGNTILAHNGTLEKFNTLATSIGMKYSDYNVDSEILAFGVNKAFEARGDNPVDLSDILGDYIGAAALMFYNTDTEYLYVFHDEKRPLYYAWDKEGGMYISSLIQPLKAAGLFEPTEFEVNTVYTIKQGEILDKKVYALYEEVHAEEIKAEKEKEKQRSKNTFRRGGSKKFPNLAKDQRGIDTEDGEVYEGFYIKARTSAKQVWGALFGGGVEVKKDNWYLCNGSTKGGKRAAMLLEIIDEKGEIGTLFPSFFDLTYFIPQEGDFVLTMTTITTRKDDKLIWKKGEIAEVISVNLDERLLTLFSERLRQNFTVDTSLVRLLDLDELDINERQEDSQQEEPIFNVDNNSEIESQENIQRLIRDFRENKDDIDTPEDIEMIDIKVFNGFVDNIDKLMKNLETKYMASEDITGEINQVNALLSLSDDKEVLQAACNCD
jgi:hypothetical protein